MTLTGEHKIVPLSVVLEDFCTYVDPLTDKDSLYVEFPYIFLSVK